LTLTLPEDEPRLGAQLVELGDRALEEHARLLDVKLPPEPIPVTIYVTDGAPAAMVANETNPHAPSAR
jgi:hypothetical protein